MAKDDDTELVAVEPTGSEETGEVVAVEGEGNQSGGEQQQQGTEANADAEATGDERLANEEDDGQEEANATEAVRAARRAERRAKKAREQRAWDRAHKELNFLRGRNEVLERRFSAVEQRQLHTESLSLDGQLDQIENQLRLADDVIKESVEKQDGASNIEASNIKLNLLDKKRALLNQKARLENESRDPRRMDAGGAVRTERPAPAEERVDPEVISHAVAWKRAHPWFKDGRADQDSAIVSAIDDRILEEGFDPATKDYWDELSSRAKEVLPHRFAAARTNGNGAARTNGAERQTESRGPVMANGARERALKPGEMYVSPERKAAMVEAGMWDDPKLRNKQLKAYRQYDEDAAAAARANA